MKRIERYIPEIHVRELNTDPFNLKQDSDNNGIDYADVRWVFPNRYEQLAYASNEHELKYYGKLANRKYKYMQTYRLGKGYGTNFIYSTKWPRIRVTAFGDFEVDFYFLDMRVGSKTFGTAFHTTIGHNTDRVIYLPKGFALAFGIQYDSGMDRLPANTPYDLTRSCVQIQAEYSLDPYDKDLQMIKIDSAIKPTFQKYRVFDSAKADYFKDTPPENFCYNP